MIDLCFSNDWLCSTTQLDVGIFTPQQINDAPEGLATLLKDFDSK
jgi:hypothetical protein